MAYWAHSDSRGLPPEDPQAHWQQLAAHLENVGRIAAELARRARPGDEALELAAKLCGYLHDFGKYTDCFQKRIRTGFGRCPHAAHGAVLAQNAKYPDVAFAIAGHHSGIPDGKGGTGTLEARIRDSEREAIALLPRATADAPLIEFVPTLGSAKISREEFDLRTRMLFSCLVDADRLDSAGRVPELAALDAGRRLRQVLRHIETLADSAPDGPVKQARREVLDDCLAAASLDQQLLSLAVPTGSGKTLATMAFALRRAALYPDRYRRVIVVIPYLSIIEQNTDVYANVFGRDAILEHHSGTADRLRTIVRKEGDKFVPEDKPEEEYVPPDRRPGTENWDAPIIVTTSVRFFESLFSNRPSDLRRAHNVARSIVILDEVQTLPRSLLAPLLSMIRELTEQWGCTFVSSTATKPAFEKPAGAGRKGF